MMNNLNNTLFGIVDSDADGLKCTIKFLWVNPLEHHDPFDENTHVHYLVETSKDVADKEVIAHLLKSKHRDVTITAIPCHLKRTEAALKIANMTGLKTHVQDFLDEKASLYWNLITDLLINIYFQLPAINVDACSSYKRTVDACSVEKLITHHRRLLNMRDNIDAWWDSRELLDELSERNE